MRKSVSISIDDRHWLSERLTQVASEVPATIEFLRSRGYSAFCIRRDKALEFASARGKRDEYESLEVESWKETIGALNRPGNFETHGDGYISPVIQDLRKQRDRYRVVGYQAAQEVDPVAIATKIASSMKIAASLGDIQWEVREALLLISDDITGEILAACNAEATRFAYLDDALGAVSPEIMIASGGKKEYLRHAMERQSRDVPGARLVVGAKTGMPIVLVPLSDRYSCAVHHDQPANFAVTGQLFIEFSIVRSDFGPGEVSTLVRRKDTCHPFRLPGCCGIPVYSGLLGSGAELALAAHFEALNHLLLTMQRLLAN